MRERILNFLDSVVFLVFLSAISALWVVFSSLVSSWTWPMKVLLLLTSFLVFLGLIALAINQVSTLVERNRQKRLANPTPTFVEGVLRATAYKHKYAIKDFSQLGASFSFSVTDPEGRSITLIQPNELSGFVLLATRLNIIDPEQQRILDQNRTLAYDLRIEMGKMGVGIGGIERQLRQVYIDHVMPFSEALDEGRFLERLMLMRSSFSVLEGLIGKATSAGKTPQT